MTAIKVYLDLPLHHRDPFDRIIIAQSIDLDLTIVSGDRQFDAYPVTRLWNVQLSSAIAVADGKPIEFENKV